MDATQERLAARFWAKVDTSGDCWLWTRGKTPSGYGAMRFQGAFHYAHRLSYELHHGPILEGMVIDHRCRNRACVNPAHLRLADYSQNAENVVRENVTGHRGVFRNRCGRGRLINTWTAVVQKDGRQYRSTHTSPEAAGEWARQMRLTLFTHNDQDRNPA